MSSITVFEKEFVERTKQILLEHDGKEEYDVTFLLNCLLGLTVLPIEKRKKDSKLEKKCNEKLKELNAIDFTDKDEKKLYHSFKNAISHMHIEIVNKEDKISEIILRDKNPSSNSNFHTELKFTYSQLKEFAIFIADSYLELEDGYGK